MDRLLLIAATLCLLTSVGYTLYALGAGRFRPGRTNAVAISLAFTFLGIFLYRRGVLEGSCPLNSLFDVLVFQSWSLLLIYLLIGPAYRLSLLGAFTSPLAFLLILAAMLAPLDQTLRQRVATPWVEFHAALSIIAYGALGLAGIAGLMYLIQDRQLKAHVVSPLFYNLPPIADLSAAIGRLLWLGFGLLTISFIAGFITQMPVNTLKFGTSLIIWLLYGVILTMQKFGGLAPRRVAGMAVGVGVFALLSLPGIQYLSSRP